MTQLDLSPRNDSFGIYAVVAPRPPVLTTVTAVAAPALPPESFRQRLCRHWEAVKFLAVGGLCFVITVAINYALKLTVLGARPVAALTIAIVIATFVSYLLNREWSFRTRGGRKPLHEAALFFGISGIGVVINDLPMWAARYLLQLRVPEVSQATQEISDLVSGILLGTLLATAFRLWAFRKWAFPHENARPAPARHR